MQKNAGEITTYRIDGNEAYVFVHFDDTGHDNCVYVGLDPAPRTLLKHAENPADSPIDRILYTGPVGEDWMAIELQIANWRSSRMLLRSVGPPLDHE